MSSLHPAFTQKSNTDNKLYSVSQRFAYEEPGYKPGIPAKTKQPLQRSKIRLRPRKVLCSKCKGICNENSENVVQTRKRKNNEVNSSAKERKSYASSESNSRNSTKTEDRTLMMGNSLIPKLSRLHPNEISNALNGNTYNRNEIWIRQADDKSETNLDMQFSGKYKNMEGSGDSNGDCLEDFRKNLVLYSSSEKSSDNKFVDDREFDSDGEQRGQKISQKCDSEISVHKKKRIENSSNNTDESSSSVFSNARTLKISFGEGEGTVVKLPVLTNSGEENSNPSFVKTDSKAARRAIKKAKKQARRQATPDTHPSSPLNETSYEIFQRKHKHKVKHKKKKKDEKKTKHPSGDVSESETPDENHTCILKNSLMNHVEETNEESLQNEDTEEMKMCDDSSSGWVNCESGFSGVVTGDVIWGKLQGFPWWPGRVVSMGEEGHARVAWFASSTSSLVPFHRLAPFLDNFKVFFHIYSLTKNIPVFTFLFIVDTFQ